MKTKIILLALLVAGLNAKGVTFGPPTIPIPEPSTVSLAMAGCGLLGLLFYKRKRKI